MSGPLFEPLVIKSLSLPNRIARSATAERLANASGVPLPALPALYETLSRGGTGLIITGHAFVRVGGRCHEEMTGVHDDYLMPGLVELAGAAHRGEGRIALQLNHGGRQCEPASVSSPVAPSAVPAREGGRVPTALDEEGISEIVAAFGRAAGRAKDAGFDAVQIHSAHGYLGSQFLSPLANRRRDGYGGSLENRARFLREVTATVRAAVEDDYPVLIKLGVTDKLDGGLTLDEGVEVASWLEDFGVDAVEVSTGGQGAMETRITRPEREAYLLPLARAVGQRCRLPIFVVGGLRTRSVMESVLDEGFAMVSLSRPLIREPDLPNRLRSQETDKATCVACNRCWPKETGDGISCKRD